jgi:hypothetical protein
LYFFFTRHTLIQFSSSGWTSPAGYHPELDIKLLRRGKQFVLLGQGRDAGRTNHWATLHPDVTFCLVYFMSVSLLFNWSAVHYFYHYCKPYRLLRSDLIKPCTKLKNHIKTNKLYLCPCLIIKMTFSF